MASIVTPWVPTVRNISNGEDVSAETINPTISQLTQRDQHLFERIQSFANKSVLIAFDIPIHPDYLGQVTENQPVYYFSDSNGEGLAPAQAAYTSSNNSLFNPSASTFAVGIVSQVKSTNKADVFTLGLITYDKEIGDGTNDTIPLLRSGESFQSGPLYLTRSVAGRLTSNPGGLAVFMGLALDSKQFLVSPNVESLNQFFVQYRISVFDKPAGVANLSGGTWSITYTTPAEEGNVGWIPAADSGAPTSLIPTNAKFFYRIPNGTLTDPGLTSDELEQAQTLREVWPPAPTTFATLVMNGVIQKSYQADTGEGSYTINEYGLWWMTDNEGEVPWSDQIDGADPAWGPAKTLRGEVFTRPVMVLDFVRYNPELAQSLVTTLTPFSDESTNNTANSVSIQDAAGNPAEKGDLFFKLDIQSSQITPTGTPPVTLPGPATGWTNGLTLLRNQALKDVRYNPKTGKLEKVSGPVISDIQGAGGVAVTVDSAGIATITFNAGGISGSTDAIEPINARLEFFGLHSYFVMRPSADLRTGLIGKIVLPATLSGNDLALSLVGVPKTTFASSSALSFNFSYAVGRNEEVIANVSTSSSVSFSPDSAVAANTQSTWIADTFVIPADQLSPNAIVNFKLERNDALVTPAYTGDFGIIAINWSLAF